MRQAVFRATLLHLGLGLAVAAGQPPAQPALPTPQPWIVAPSVVTPAPAPPPIPTPSPDAVVSLPADALYVLDIREPCFWMLSRPDVIRVTQVAGPWSAFAKFVGGSGEMEDKTFAGPVVLRVRSAGNGRVQLTVIKVGAQGPADVFVQTIETGKAPEPTPAPTPTPEPPKDIPFPGDGLRVLFLYEADKLSTYSASMLDVLNSQEIRDYLNVKAAVGPDGKTREFRFWKYDVNASQAPKMWQDALKRTRTGLPWLIVSNGKSAYEGPLPATVEEALTLLKKYGG